jgi:hypothetical protein
MLLPEDRLDMMVEQLGSMSRPDRKAVLARLTRFERQRVRAHLRRPAATAEEAASPYSADIAACLRDDAALTSAGRRALDAFLSAKTQSVRVPPARGASLVQGMTGLLRGRGRVS